MTVTLHMTDSQNNNVKRTIDGSNLLIDNRNAAPGWEGSILAPKYMHERLLNRWIEERGNDQHNTILTLSHYIINK